MGRFCDKLILKEYGSKEWSLYTDYTYKTLVLNQEFYTRITAPTGFINDLASIPRVLQSLIPKVGKHRGAAVIHDWLYYRRGEIHEGLKITRKQCDLIFLEAMKTADVWWLRRQAMYRAVRAGGWVFWNKPRTDDRMTEAP